jgi:hypothetical protein
MKSSNYNNITNQVQKAVEEGEASLLLQKLEMEYSINSHQEFANYILILLTLLEQPTCFEQVSNLLLRKVLTATNSFKIEQMQLYDTMVANKVLPFIGLSSFFSRLIRTLVYNKPEDQQAIKYLPAREYLTGLNGIILKDYIAESICNGKVALSLLYNCISEIQFPESKIILDLGAVEDFKAKLDSDFEFVETYLSHFFRFYWYGGARNNYEGKLIVPEPFYQQIFGGTDKFIKHIKAWQEISSNNVQILINDIFKYLDKATDAQGIPYDVLDFSINHHINIREELSRF